MKTTLSGLRTSCTQATLKQTFYGLNIFLAIQLISTDVISQSCSNGPPANPLTENNKCK